MGVLKEMRNLGQENKGLDTRIDGQRELFKQGYNAATSLEESHTNRKNFQTYPYDYFCGTNAKVFFGDIWVDDIVTIQYLVRQDKEPIYGYASQNFDAIARGHVIVQGSFTIAFKEMGYLNVIQNTLEGQRSAQSQRRIGEVYKAALEDIASGKVPYDSRLERLGGEGVVFAPTGQPDIIRREQTIEDILMYKKSGNVIQSGLAVQFGFDSDSASKERDFEDFAELLEDTIWGDSNGKPFTIRDKINLRRADEFDYTWDGNNDLGGIKVATKYPDGDDYSQVLNILITFGDINDYRAEHTVIALNDVHIVNTSMTIGPTGEPIGETYMFIARDVNKALSKQVLKNLSPFKYNVGLGKDQEFKTAREEDLIAVENFLKSQESPHFRIAIYTLSRFAFDGEGRLSGSWRADNDVISTTTLTTVNAWDSKLDQIIKAVERIINDPTGNFSTSTKDRTAFAQWLLEVRIYATTRARDGYEPAGEFETVNMIIDQQIPNTLTYRVISPTRDNFGSIGAFTRADMWKVLPPEIRNPIAGAAEVDADAVSKGTTATEETTDLPNAEETVPSKHGASGSFGPNPLGETPEEREKNLSVKAGLEAQTQADQKVGVDPLLQQAAEGIDYATKAGAEQSKFRIVVPEEPLSTQTEEGVIITPIKEETQKTLPTSSTGEPPPSAKAAGAERLIFTESATGHINRGSSLSQDAVFAKQSGERVPLVFAPEAGTLAEGREGKKETVFISEPRGIQTEEGMVSEQYGIVYSHTEPIKELIPTSYSIASAAPSNQVYAGQTIGTQVPDIGKTGEYKGKELALHVHITGFILREGKPDYSPAANAKAQERARQAYARQKIFTEIK